MEKNFKLQIFTKIPIEGTVKKRLIPKLGVKVATKLYQVLLRHTIRIALQASISEIEIWVPPKVNYHLLSKFIPANLPLRIQNGKNIGERMCHAVRSSLQDNYCPILIGCDNPNLTAHNLSDAAKALVAKNDFVFLPMEDGGYSLIATRTFNPSVFQNIPWGTNDVMKRTRQLLNELNYKWVELDMQWDVDRPEDFERLKNEYPNLLN